MIKQKGQAPILVLAGIVLVAVLIGGAFYLGRTTLRQDSSGQASPKPQPQNPVVTSTPQPSPSPIVNPLPSPTLSSLNFNFVFRFNEDTVDTFQGKFNYHYKMDTPPLVVNLSLSQGEMKQIYQKMMEINFFDYPEKFSTYVPPGSKVQIVTPSDSYYFKVEHNSTVKEVTWEKDDIVSPLDDKTIKLRELIKLIYDVLDSQEELRNLPAKNYGRA